MKSEILKCQKCSKVKKAAIEYKSLLWNFGIYVVSKKQSIIQSKEIIKDEDVGKIIDILM